VKKFIIRRQFRTTLCRFKWLPKTSLMGQDFAWSKVKRGISGCERYSHFVLQLGFSELVTFADNAR